MTHSISRFNRGLIDSSPISPRPQTDRANGGPQPAPAATVELSAAARANGGPQPAPAAQPAVKTGYKPEPLNIIWGNSPER